MKRFLVLPVSLVVAAVVVGGCSATPTETAHSTSTPPSTTVVVPAPAAPAAAPKPATRTVPAHLVGKTVGAAKAALKKAGFTHVVIAGGSDVTDSSAVAAVTDTGKAVAPSTKIVITGLVPVSAPTAQNPKSTAGTESKSQSGCGQRAVNAGKFNPLCSEYQGYLDPGTAAGRAPTSGEIQMQWACQQGLVPKSEC